ncbi:pentatricopeptide repeat-containing protein At5g46460, mitochondrial [Momordica charantia]|uniref:Pentatricopeptide repeat-containing protein At5g46460, mitochondrial n=1 Tax=Momordica charantia TaxID=3673 RepID=A0A6J1CKH5_MOMCH|nr:pentatricopeptide repeat-containing protein At5g46460, mitochondrial [Momordica charantia]
MRIVRANLRTSKILPLSFEFSLSVLRTSSSLISSNLYVCLSKNFSVLTTPSYNSLLSLHLRNGRIDEARSLFNKISSPGVSLYTMMIAGYAEKGRLDDALILFDEMPVKDLISWNSMLKGCLNCGDLSMAWNMFDKMPERNVVSWTTIIDGLLEFGRVEIAERLFWEMPTRDVAAWNSMIHGYFSNGRVEDAFELFEKMPLRNVISWTSMIGGLGQNGKSFEALLIFQKMLTSFVKPTPSTLACVLTVCANMCALFLGVQIHGLIVKTGYCFDEYISASLITFYANCKLIENASDIFNDNLRRNVVVWTALLTGYGLNCKHENALQVFKGMMRICVIPNQSSLTSALNSCCGLEAVDRGREVHTVAHKLGLENDIFVSNSLVVMYTKCGYIYDGVAVFTRMSIKNVVSWNSIIVGCAQHGFGMWALTLFAQMIRARVDADEITLVGLLSACSHSGMLTKGRCFFKHFGENLCIEMTDEHYASMVDLLGRCGRLEEAEALILNMPIKANYMVWLALLSSSTKHYNVDVAERAAKCLLDQQPNCSAAYILLSNLYASTGKWNEVSRVRKKMKDDGILKQPGSSWITIKGVRHDFLSGDRSHPLSRKIYQKLEWLGGKLKELGYVPDPKFSLHDVETEQKEEMLSYHSERLAIGFGLISTVEGSTITVMKNLRVCGDCHNAIKLIAKVVGREIVVRDSSRFHHFHSGTCSCGDYW